MSATSKDHQPIKKGQPSEQSALSGPNLIFLTALDTTWRAFVPTLGGTFLGIWLDSLLGSSPIALIVCLIGGTVLSFTLIAQQLISVRKPRR
jgi:hypothetical protein